MHATCADILIGICRWQVVIVSARDLTALYEALSHAVSATLTATNTLAISSKRTQKTCNETIHTINTITLHIANIKSLARDVTNATAMYSNSQQH